jgi:hypothetical protein
VLVNLQETPYGKYTHDGLFGHQTPRINIVSPYSTNNDYIKAKNFLDLVGIKLDPWQLYILECSLGRRDNGLWAARTLGLVIARQNGKSEFAAARILIGLFVLKEKKIIYSSHRNDLAHEIFERVEEMILASPLLKKRTKHISHTNGKEGIRTNDGCQVVFKTRKKNSGRGFSCDCLIVDEAMDADRQFVKDVEPVVSARMNPQMIYMGSAGTQDSLAFGDKRRRALSNSPGLMTWLEWSAELHNDDCDLDCSQHLRICDEDCEAQGIDPYTCEEHFADNLEAYRQTNPAYGMRVDHEAIVEEWKSMIADLSGFHIERLSIGDWPVDLVEFGVISRENWEKALLEVNPVGQIIFSVSMKPDLTGTVITMVGFTDESQTDMVVHVVEESARSGKTWLKERLKELNTKWKPYGFAIDSRGQASTIIEDLTDDGITVYSPSSLEYAQACAQFAIGVSGTKKERGYIHHVNDPALTAAVAGAGTRKLSGLDTAWARAHDLANIVALEAATLGVWGLKRAVKDSASNQIFFKRAGRR